MFDLSKFHQNDSHKAELVIARITEHGIFLEVLLP